MDEQSSLDEGEYQTPIVALVFNFSARSDSLGRSYTLSLQELETLYHEWGHACHSLISRTTFQVF